eukprot:CAMPEP_0183832754 /NCGR_PEP_ID=MMETSP0807_2-20130328/5640_1 /TAXON_ID=88271 /ORGANISM="Picocystis salinarum, Strain CCMP1897" /LENGTH=272 /DNA_ID=CAMNT_0026078553 /DNA_START=103 /DNA_END=919 /DNA_ORIENTATION=-
MAEHLATIFGTEKDRVNCPFYFKIGRCRHGERCSRQHNRPAISPTLLVPNMYVNPFGRRNDVDPVERQDHFDDFYEDVYREMSKHGKVECMHVCANEAEHMNGNMYVKFCDEEDAAEALKAMQAQTYEGRLLMPEFSPVTDFEKPLAASTKKEDAKEADSAILCTCTNPVWSSANFWVSILVEAEVAVGRGIEAAQGEDRPAHTKEEVTDGAQVRTAGGLDESRPLENESGIAGGTKAENIEAVGVPGAPVLGSITGTKARKEGPKSHVGTW